MKLSTKQVIGVAVALIAAAIVVTSVLRPSSPRSCRPAVGGSELDFGHFAAVPGTEVFRAELFDGNSGSYSSYSRTRNIAFIETSGSARWLLPDDDHVIDEYPVPAPKSYLQKPERPVAIAALVTPAVGKREPGTLLLFDPTGRTVQTVADQVYDVHGITLSGDDEITMLYEQESKYVMVTFERSTLAKTRETTLSFPQLK